MLGLVDEPGTATNTLTTEIMKHDTDITHKQVLRAVGSIVLIFFFLNVVTHDLRVWFWTCAILHAILTQNVLALIGIFIDPTRKNVTELSCCKSQTLRKLG